MTSTTFPNLTGTASNLDITPQHITFDNASVTDSSTETLAGILSITDPSVTVSNFDYEFGPNTIAGSHHGHRCHGFAVCEQRFFESKRPFHRDSK